MLETLQDVDFPAGKEELVQAAENAAAPDEVVKALRAIPPDEYGNRDEVARSARVDPASDLDLSAAQRAEQAWRGGRPGQSQHPCVTSPSRRSTTNSTSSDPPRTACRHRNAPGQRIERIRRR
ncbi:DUF2795 domain-containing protein [Streptomyces sp. NPDC058145]|uniref:DUF2795 domain-containing protein n=1 Tax=Streptomyces sp. NPDC058145 TaxID=3346356 RepID=UPI0036E1F927